MTQSRQIALCLKSGTANLLIVLFSVAPLFSQGYQEKGAEVNRLLKQAADYLKTANFPQSREAFQQALALSQKQGDDRSVLRSLQGIADVYARQYDIPPALDYYNRALEVARKLNDAQSEFFILTRIGKCYGDMKDYKRAVPILQEALAIVTQKDDKGWMERLWTDIGIAYYSAGLFQDALEHYFKAVEIALSMDGKGHEGYIFVNIGEIYRRTREYDKARDYYEKAGEYARRTGAKNLEYGVWQSLGRMEYETGRYSQAMVYFEKALDHAQTVNNKLNIGSCLNSIGKTRMKQGDFKAALDILAQSRKIFEAIQSPNMMHPMNSIGDILLEQHKSSKALELFQKGLSIALDRHVFNYIIEMHYKVGRAHEEMKDYRAALDSYEKAIAEVESVRGLIRGARLKSGFLSGYLKVYAHAAYVLLQLHKEEPERGYDRAAFHMAEKSKARSFLDSLEESRMNLASQLAEEERIEVQNIDREISAALTGLQKPGLSEEDRQSLLDQLRQTEERYEMLRERIIAAHPKYAAVMNPEPQPAGIIQKKLLDEKTALLSFFCGEDHSLAFVLTLDSLHVFDLGPEQPLNELAVNYLLAVQKTGDSGYLEAARGLFLKIISPAAHILSQNIDRLIIIPDQNLHYLPFETLIVSEEEESSRPHFWVEDLALSYAPSASLLIQLQERKPDSSPKKDFLGVGDPVYSFFEPESAETITSEDILRSSFLDKGYDFPPLEFSSKEIQSAARHFKKKKRQALTREKASEDMVKNQPLSDYKILHFAAHGAIDEQSPLRSAVVLTQDEDPTEDGFLQVREVYDLNLRADLVVLSACRSARGKLISGEGVSGLSRSFLYAGANSVVASLWNIKDRSTVDFMKVFYEALAKGLDRADALRQAKIKMIHSPFHHPAYWGAFILIGESRNPVTFDSPSFWERFLFFLR